MPRGCSRHSDMLLESQLGPRSQGYSPGGLRRAWANDHDLGEEPIALWFLKNQDHVRPMQLRFHRLYLRCLPNSNSQSEHSVEIRTIALGVSGAFDTQVFQPHSLFRDISIIFSSFESCETEISHIKSIAVSAPYQPTLICIPRTHRSAFFP